MDFGFIPAQFFDIFLYLSALLVLVIFDNPSMRKRVSCKSKGNKFSTFSAFFVDFVSSSFFIRFCDIFEAILGSIWHHFLEKKPFRKSLQKMGPPHSKTPPHPRVRWLLETPPRVRASRTETMERARIQVRFQLELELWLEFVSKFELIAIRNRKIARKWLLELASIAKVSKTVRKNGRADIKTQC